MRTYHAALAAGVSALVLTGLGVAAAPGASAETAALTDLLVTETNAAHNELVVLGRHPDGTLEQVQRLATGLAGTANYINTGNAVVAFPGNRVLAINAGSNAVSVVQRTGTTLAPVASFFSGGDVPTSLAVSGTRVYVLNTGLPAVSLSDTEKRIGPPTLQGFTIDAAGNATAIPGARRSLPGACHAYPCTVNDSFGQASVSPDGRSLLISNTSHALMYTLAIASDGSLGPVVSAPSTVTQPYGFGWTPNGVAVVSGADGNARDSAIIGLVMSGRIAHGRWTPIVAHQRTRGAGTCWVTVSADGTRAYAIDAGGNALPVPPPGITTFAVGRGGSLRPIGFTSVPFSDATFPLDSALSGDQRTLYSTSFQRIYVFDIDAAGVAHHAPAKDLLPAGGLVPGTTGLVDLPLG